MNVHEFRGDEVHPNSKVQNFRWLISYYDETVWIFHINHESLYFRELEGYHDLESAKKDLISRHHHAKDNDVDNNLYVRDIKDGRSETFYKLKGLKDTLKEL